MNGRSILILLALASPAAAAPQDRKPASEIQFTRSYESAFEEANQRGVPILILVVQDDEEANDDVWANTINSAAFVAATRRTVNLIGNRGTQELHGFDEVERDGKTLRLCRKFGSITCSDHIKAEVAIFRDFASDGMVRTPLVMLILPDQTIVATLIDRHPMEDFLAAFKQAEKALPNGLDQDEAAVLHQKLVAANAQMESGDYAPVILAALPLVRRDTQAQLVKEMVGLLEKIETRGREELAEVEQKIQARDYVAAVEQLERMTAQYRKSVVETVVKERKAQLGKNKDVKAALAQAKKEESARTLLENADALRDQGQQERAEALYDRIRERFPDTAAGRELKERGGSG